MFLIDFTSIIVSYLFGWMYSISFVYFCIFLMCMLNMISPEIYVLFLVFTHVQILLDKNFAIFFLRASLGAAEMSHCVMS